MNKKIKEVDGFDKMGKCAIVVGALIMVGCIVFIPDNIDIKLTGKICGFAVGALLAMWALGKFTGNVE